MLVNADLIPYNKIYDNSSNVAPKPGRPHVTTMPWLALADIGKNLEKRRGPRSAAPPAEAYIFPHGQTAADGGSWSDRYVDNGLPRMTIPNFLAVPSHW